jgi:AraC family transcriptional regulator
MSELADADRTSSLPPVVQFAPPDIARRRIATWNGIQADAVEVVRRDSFQASFEAPSHLLIMCERAERDDGKTILEGRPRRQRMPRQEESPDQGMAGAWAYN